MSQRPEIRLLARGERLVAELGLQTVTAAERLRDGGLI
jgi:hypothetical protein